MSRDRETLDVYDARAADYADFFDRSETDPRLTLFLSRLAPGGRVLDLGCGPGRAAAQMATEGFAAVALDASAEMIALAGAHPGVEAHHAGFEAIPDLGRFAAIWASFSLLHAPRDEMPGHLAAIHAALDPGGWLMVGLKTGTGAARDGLGRLYTYYGEAEIAGLLEATGFRIDSTETGADRGLDDVVAPWIILIAERVG